ncbi:hypothetical protein [Aeromonas salmonicida]|uniref:hypothetical protein n=1 Tax=Aeromonas salmonicida TaxID=645 RepID=UPI003D024620
MTTATMTNPPPLVDLDHYYLTYANPWLPAHYEHLEIHIAFERTHTGHWTRHVIDQQVTFLDGDGQILCTITAL